MSGTDRAQGKAQPGASNNIESSSQIAYGLPCSHCGTYYDAGQSACPVCNCAERVQPTAPTPHFVVPDQPAHGADQLEERGERFSKEFKTQLHASEAVTANQTHCRLEENHKNKNEVAEVCGACYAQLQERADLMEAALHMDLNEAAQIVYDAVWEDPSQPAKTYHNAAQALLTELRKRAGIDLVLTTLQLYKH